MATIVMHTRRGYLNVHVEVCKFEYICAIITFCYHFQFRFCVRVDLEMIELPNAVLNGRFT